MDNLIINALSIDGAAVVESNVSEDSRGSFKRAYCQRELGQLMNDKTIVNVNISKTIGIGTVRGLHFQYPPGLEMKVIQCVKGKVWDVMVDVRENSQTFLSWQGIELSEEDNKFIVIPEGVAHGFQTLKHECELLYMHTAYYDKSLEGGLRYSDKEIGIDWPITVSNCSKRDSNHPLIDRATFKGVAYEV